MELAIEEIEQQIVLSLATHDNLELVIHHSKGPTLGCASELLRLPLDSLSNCP